jgi:hypothetical protein
MSDKMVHAYGGREHDAETTDPKCLLCKHEKLREDIAGNLVRYSTGELSAVAALIEIRKVMYA